MHNNDIATGDVSSSFKSSRLQKKCERNHIKLLVEKQLLIEINVLYLDLLNC